MLKRADLLKKLELGVQQEIKNYNDSLSTILLRLNHMNDAITQVEEGALENDAAIVSAHKSFEILADCREEARTQEYKRICVKFTQLEQQIEKVRVDAEIAYQNSIEANRKSEFNQNTIDRLSATVETIEDELSGFTGHIHNKVEGLSFQLKKDISRAKDEILSLPSEAKSVKQDLEQKITSHAVDVEGLLKEIRTTNKAMMVLEKKIEHLYTLVGRLQKEGAP